jgi:hypothetical protein
MLTNILKLISNNGDNTFISAPHDANVLILELQLFIRLPSIPEIDVYAEDPLLSEEQRNAIFWREASLKPNKKIVSYWNNGQQNRLVEFIVFNRQPYYVEDLMTRFTAQPNFLIQAGSSLNLQIESTNSGLLGSGDSLTVWGQAEILGV